MTIPTFCRWRPWKDFQIDYELEDSWLERLNSLPNISVHGSCSGHPRGKCPNRDKVSQDHPNFLISFHGRNSSKRALEVGRALLSDETRVDARIKIGGEFYWMDERLEHPRQRSDIRNKPPDLDITSKIAHSGENQVELGEWWERTLAILEAAASQ